MNLLSNAVRRVETVEWKKRRLLRREFFRLTHCPKKRNNLKYFTLFFSLRPGTKHACFWLIVVLNCALHAISLTIFRISTKISPLSFAHGPQSESESEKLQQRETATATATATVMTETDKNTGRLLLLLLLSDTLGSIFAAVAANSPCCVRHMRQLAVCCRCYWERESKRAGEREWRVHMYVYVCECVFVWITRRQANKMRVQKGILGC